MMYDIFDLCQTVSESHESKVIDSRDDPSRVSYALLNTNRGCSSIVRSDIHIDPCDVQTRSVVDSYGAKKGGEVLDSVR